MSTHINSRKFYEDMCNSLDPSKLLEDYIKNVVEYSISCPVCKKIVINFDHHIKEMTDIGNIEHTVYYIHES